MPSAGGVRAVIGTNVLLSVLAQNAARVMRIHNAIIVARFAFMLAAYSATKCGFTAVNDGEKRKPAWG
jgi:hypothetical protein